MEMYTELEREIKKYFVIYTHLSSWTAFYKLDSHFWSQEAMISLFRQKSLATLIPSRLGKHYFDVEGTWSVLHLVTLLFGVCWCSFRVWALKSLRSNAGLLGHTSPHNISFPPECDLLLRRNSSVFYSDFRMEGSNVLYVEYRTCCLK